MTIRGLLLGKFMPPHKGHQFLGETALEMVDQLTVLVCSTPDEPIDGHLRFNWMQQTLPHATCVHLHRHIPQAPEDHPDFWNIWRTVINDRHPDPSDLTFGSDPYIFKLASELNSKPVLIDPFREIFAVSGSKIRSDPKSNWQYICSAARRSFQKHVCLLGPESTGKSQLAQNLAAHFKTKAMPEYGRAYDVHYMQSHMAQGEGWSERNLIDLAQTHRAMRAALTPNAGYLLIEDTDILQTIVWARYLLERPCKILEQMAAKEKLADFYLLLSPTMAWIDDGTRYAGDNETRVWFYEKAKTLLTEFNVPFEIVNGDTWEVRTDQGIDHCQRFFDL